MHHNGRKNPPPPPKDMVGPRVVHLSRIIKQHSNEAMAEEGLFSGQQYILFTLSEKEGMTLTDLANELGIATATASISVKRMEKAGFIQRKPDKNDARIIRLYLTQKGKTAPENVRKKMDALEGIFKQGMTQQEVMLLSELLDRATQNLIKEELD